MSVLSCDRSEISNYWGHSHRYEGRHALLRQEHLELSAHSFRPSSEQAPEDRYGRIQSDRRALDGVEGPDDDLAFEITVQWGEDGVNDQEILQFRERCYDDLPVFNGTTRANERQQV